MKVLVAFPSLLLLSIGKAFAFSSGIGNLRSINSFEDSHALMRAGNIPVCWNNRPKNGRRHRVSMNVDSAEKDGIDDWITRSSIKAQQLENAPHALKMKIFQL